MRQWSIWPRIRFDYKLIELWKAFRHFLTANRKKTFQRIFNTLILAVKESFERFSCLEFIFEKSKRREAGLKHKQGFSETLFTCLGEWKLLSLYMFHRIIILLLIVSSLFCNFNRCAVCFQSLTNIACRSSQNAACIKRFWRLHIVIK